MLNNVDIVIFHSPCFDGGAGAWVVKQWCEENKKPEPVFFGTKPGLSEYKFPELKDQSVAVVDICFDRETMKRFADECKELIVLDHHKTSEENMVGFDFAIFDNARSGCQLAWDYFFPNSPRPKVLDHIADRDLWTWSDPLSKAYSSAMFNRYGFLSPEETIQAVDTLSKMDDREYKDFVAFGQHCLDFQAKQIDSALKHAVRCNLRMPDDTEIPVWTSNSRLHRSDIGNSLSKRDGGEFALMYSYDIKSNEWWISLRSDNDREQDRIYDVGAVAQNFPRGGGHKCAAGFTWTSPITDLLTPIPVEE